MVMTDKFFWCTSDLWKQSKVVKLTGSLKKLGEIKKDHLEVGNILVHSTPVLSPEGL